MTDTDTTHIEVDDQQLAAVARRDKTVRKAVAAAEEAARHAAGLDSKVLAGDATIEAADLVLAESNARLSLMRAKAAAGRVLRTERAKVEAERAELTAKVRTGAPAQLEEILADWSTLEAAAAAVAHRVEAYNADLAATVERLGEIGGPVGLDVRQHEHTESEVRVESLDITVGAVKLDMLIADAVWRGLEAAGLDPVKFNGFQRQAGANPVGENDTNVVLAEMLARSDRDDRVLSYVDQVRRVVAVLQDAAS